MDTKKYVDMAFTNPNGKVWLRTLHKKEVWAQWLEKVAQIGLSDRPTEEYANDIITSAIWHLGYTNDLRCEIHGKGVRCMQRLRGEESVNITDSGAGGLPREFYVLDDFLEHEVRHLIPYKV